MDTCYLWSERLDLNQRPLGPEPSAIPNFATPRNCSAIISSNSRIVNCFFYVLMDLL